jgi:hypothetical protein
MTPPSSSNSLDRISDQVNELTKTLNGTVTQVAVMLEILTRVENKVDEINERGCNYIYRGGEDARQKEVDIAKSKDRDSVTKNSNGTWSFLRDKVLGPVLASLAIGLAMNLPNIILAINKLFESTK